LVISIAQRVGPNGGIAIFFAAPNFDHLPDLLLGGRVHVLIFSKERLIENVGLGRCFACINQVVGCYAEHAGNLGNLFSRRSWRIFIFEPAWRLHS
jgi:hypothetical protein